MEDLSWKVNLSSWTIISSIFWFKRAREGNQPIEQEGTKKLEDCITIKHEKKLQE